MATQKEINEAILKKLSSIDKTNENNQSQILKWIAGVIGSLIVAGSFASLAWVVSGINNNSSELLIIKTKNTANEKIMNDILITLKALSNDFVKFSSRERFVKEDDQRALENFKVKYIDPIDKKLIHIETLQKERADYFKEIDNRLDDLEIKIK